MGFKKSIRLVEIFPHPPSLRCLLGTSLIMRLIINIIRDLLGKFEYESSSSNDKFPTVTDLSQKIVLSMNMPISLSIPSYHKEFCLWYRKVALACSLLSSSTTMRYDGWFVTGDDEIIELLRVLFGLIHSLLRIRIHIYLI